jgi:anaerobic carbon-monoxide dehydrogenase catalytic subunit
MLQERKAPAAPQAIGDAHHWLPRLEEHLAKAIRIGLVRGVVALIGHAAPWSAPGEVLAGLARECIGQDLLVVATGRALRPLEAAGLCEASALDVAGSGLAELCALCELPPVIACPGPDTAPLLTLCARLAADLGVTVTQLPVIAPVQDAPGAGGVWPEMPLETLLATAADPAGLAAAISRRITASRLALGLNDRFDGSVYS